MDRESSLSARSNGKCALKPAAVVRVLPVSPHHVFSPNVSTRDLMMRENGRTASPVSTASDVACT
jgi:hypothetical protein